MPTLTVDNRSYGLTAMIMGDPLDGSCITKVRLMNEATGGEPLPFSHPHEALSQLNSSLFLMSRMDLKSLFHVLLLQIKSGNPALTHRAEDKPYHIAPNRLL